MRPRRGHINQHRDHTAGKGQAHLGVTSGREEQECDDRPHRQRGSNDDGRQREIPLPQRHRPGAVTVPGVCAYRSKESCCRHPEQQPRPAGRPEADGEQCHEMSGTARQKWHPEAGPEVCESPCSKGQRNTAPVVGNQPRCLGVSCRCKQPFAGQQSAHFVRVTGMTRRLKQPHGINAMTCPVNLDAVEDNSRVGAQRPTASTNLNRGLATSALPPVPVAILG